MPSLWVASLAGMLVFGLLLRFTVLRGLDRKEDKKFLDRLAIWSVQMEARDRGEYLPEREAEDRLKNYKMRV